VPGFQIGNESFWRLATPGGPGIFYFQRQEPSCRSENQQPGERWVKTFHEAGSLIRGREGALIPIDETKSRPHLGHFQRDGHALTGKKIGEPKSFQFSTEFGRDAACIGFAN
jgi:hypothetical protein